MYSQPGTHSPSVNLAAEECLDLFSAALQAFSLIPGKGNPLPPGISSSDAGKLRIEQERFRMWTLNATALGEDRKSLDYRLRELPEELELVRTLLSTISCTLQAYETAVKESIGVLEYQDVDREGDDLTSLAAVAGLTSDTRASMQAAVSCTEADGPEEIPAKPHTFDDPEALDSIHLSIDWLHRLSNLLRRASVVNQNLRARSYNMPDLNEHSLRLFFDWLVKRDFPGLSEQLKSRMVSTMVERRRRILYRRQRLSSGWRKQQSNRIQGGYQRPASAGISPSQSNAMEVPECAGEKRDQAVDPLRTPNRTLLSAKTGTEPNRTLYRAYAASTITGARSGALSHSAEVLLPPPPPACQTAPDFVCDYCCMILDSRVGRDATLWTQHLQRDLDPYICLFDRCNNPHDLYSTSTDWLQHMRVEHLVKWRCSATDHDVLDLNTREELSQHMTDKHPDTFDQELFPYVIEASRVSCAVVFEECPFCGKAPDAIEQHVGDHLRYLALKSLPWPEYADDREAEKDDDYYTMPADKNMERETLDQEFALLDSDSINSEYGSQRLLELTEQEQSRLEGRPRSNQDRQAEWGFILEIFRQHENWRLNMNEFYSQNNASTLKLSEFDRSIYRLRLSNAGLAHREDEIETMEDINMVNRSQDQQGTKVASRTLAIIVAVDFGSMFSGVAYATTFEPQNLKLVTNWGAGLTGEKVPTVLKYDNGGTTGPLKWGFEATRNRRPGELIHERFKNGLCFESQEIHANRSKILNKSGSPPVTGEQCESLVTDYLSCLRASTDRYFKDVFDGRANEITKQYIVTVPATWSDKAQNTLRACAARAGMGKKEELQIIAESEAAGIYALDMMPKIGLQVDDTFVVCDAGASTVDLSSYTVKSIEPHACLAGAAIESGGLCGSSFLNEKFAEYIIKKLQGYIREWDQTNLRWLKWTVDNDFESYVKPGFTGYEADDYNYFFTAFNFRDSLEHNIRNETLEISAKDIRELVFDPVISEIQDLVRQQIAATSGKVKAVLLVGGFASNVYLKRRLEAIVGAGVRLHLLENSGTAIVRGALIAGLAQANRRRRQDMEAPKMAEEGQQGHGEVQARVVSRLAGKNYGIPAFEVYDPLKHADGEHLKIVQGGHAGGFIIKTMQWFITMGEEIVDGVPRHFGLFYEREVSKGPPSEISCAIYACRDRIPPRYPDSPAHPSPALRYPLVKLNIDLSKIPIERLLIEKRQGREFYKIDFDVQMTLQSASLSFALVHDGHVYKPETVQFI